MFICKFSAIFEMLLLSCMMLNSTEVVVVKRQDMFVHITNSIGSSTCTLITRLLQVFSYCQVFELATVYFLNSGPNLSIHKNNRAQIFVPLLM